MNEQDSDTPPATKPSESLTADLEAFVKTAQAAVVEIERRRADAEKAKGEIDAQLAAMREAVAALNQQVEAAKAAMNELTNAADSGQSQAKDAGVQTNAMLETLRVLGTTATESASRIEGLKTQVEQAAEVAAQRSQHIEEGKEYVDKKRAEADVIVNTAQKSASDAEAQHQVARSAADNLNNLFAAAQTTKANVESSAANVAKLEQQCQEHAATAKKLADIAVTTEENVKGYEARLAELEIQAAERLKTIIGLLPRGDADRWHADARGQRGGERRHLHRLVQRREHPDDGGRVSLCVEADRGRLRHPRARRLAHEYEREREGGRDDARRPL